MNYKAFPYLEELNCLKAQNALMESHVRKGQIVDAFEMIRSQNQYLDYLIERKQPGGE